MYWFTVTGASQKISTEKISVLSKTLKKNMVTMGLALIIYHSIKQFTNLQHYGRCSKEKVQSWAKHIEIFQILA